ncbi:MAG: TlpA disulfide reductase family protein [Acidimicrobiales bacterium]
MSPSTDARVADERPTDAAASGPAGPPRQRLDARTIVLAVAVALVAAILAGAIAARVLADDGGKGSSSAMTLTDEGDLDVAALQRVPLELPSGEPTTLAELQQVAERANGTAGPTLVNLWQSTCAPCVAEMPLLDEAQQRHPTLTIVGVDPQERAAKAQEFAKKTAITYPWVLDPKAELFNAAQAPGLPTSILLDEQDRFVASHTGAFTSAAELDEFVAQAG